MSQTILAVDDSRTIRQLVEACLKGAGFNVVTAEDGQDGLAKLEGCEPDVIITDINMPNLDGYGFISAVRGGMRSAAAPILVLTTESSQEKKARARDAGATGWIVKPFSPDKLLAAINRVLA
ncbi:response regulator [Notoacmeibacter ruber]|uniref:Response regulator n=1 Tax=Notoacmeibacter ruber TaxID=2670375 RepID=A0A3L7JDG9_9HYPH|nr:response regulator [Notoacmeibacter ruber]RLQ88807.1 response regulator [Notoacmeibacter ruber]